jgi:mono/diheme cytochrome c family protein
MNHAFAAESGGTEQNFRGPGSQPARARRMVKFMNSRETDLLLRADRRRRWDYRLLLAACWLFLGGCEIREDVGPDALTALRTTQLPAELAAGEDLFNAHCSICHGRLALGTRRGPPLVHPIYAPNHHADVAFQIAVRDGVRAHHFRYGDMPAVPGLSREQVGEIIAYVRWLQVTAGIE